MQRRLFFPRRRTKHWAHVSQAVRGPRCRAEQSSVYICMSSGAGGPATCPWHLPQEASPPPANQKKMPPKPCPRILSQGSTEPVIPKRSPPPPPLHLLHLVPDPQMMAAQAEATATGGARCFTFAPPSPHPPTPTEALLSCSSLGCRVAAARLYSPQLCEDVVSAGY